MTEEVTSIGVPLTELQLKGIGLVVHNWTKASYIFQHGIWALAPCTIASGKAMTAHMPDATLLDVFRALVSDREELGELSELANSFDELRQERNLVVHGLWAGDPGDLAKLHKVSNKGKVRTRTHYWSEADLNDLADDIEQWAVRFVNGLQSTVGWPPP